MAKDNQPTQIEGITRKLAFSTSTPLAANAVYTSPTVDISYIKTTIYRSFSDVAGSIAFQCSDDGNIWDTFITSAPGAGAVAQSAQTPPGKYYRVVYTNGAAAQATFRLSVYTLPL